MSYSQRYRGDGTQRPFGGGFPPFPNTNGGNISTAGYEPSGNTGRSGYSGQPPFEQIYPVTTPTLQAPPATFQRQYQTPPSQNPPQQPRYLPSQPGAPPQYAGAPTNIRDGVNSTYPPIRQLLANQRVEVLLDARGWVVGVVVAMVKAIDMVTDWGYQVRYRVPGEREREGRFSFDRVRSTTDM